MHVRSHPFPARRSSDLCTVFQANGKGGAISTIAEISRSVAVRQLFTSDRPQYRVARPLVQAGRQLLQGAARIVGSLSPMYAELLCILRPPVSRRREGWAHWHGCVREPCHGTLP